MTSNRRWLLVILVAVAVMTASLVALTSGGTLADDGPTGTLALERVAGDLGFDVDRGDEPPATGTFLLATDLRDPDQADDVLGWVRRGNRLVVADPNSAILDLLDIRPTSRVGTAVSGVELLQPDCDLPEVVGVGTVALRVSERRLELPEGLAARTCFDDIGAPWLAIVTAGDGEVVLLGGSSVFRNELFRSDDNPTFALRVLGPTGRVRIGSPAPVASGRGGLWASLPDAARALVLAALVAAAVVFAASWRRLGTPVPEVGNVVVDASTLLPSVAGLFRESGDRGHVSSRLQAHLADLVRRRSGIPVDAPTADVAAVLADLTGTQPAAALRLLTDVPVDEEGLVRLARDVHHTLDALESR